MKIIRFINNLWTALVSDTVFFFKSSFGVVLLILAATSAISAILYGVGWLVSRYVRGFAEAEPMFIGTLLAIATIMLYVAILSVIECIKYLKSIWDKS